MSRIPLDRSHGIRGARDQAGAFYARERSRELREPTANLHRTHDLPRLNLDTFDTLERFPDPAGDGLVTVRLDCTPVSGGNVIAGIGGSSFSTRGLYLGALGTTVLLSVGAGTSQAQDNVLTALSVPSDRPVSLVGAVRPGDGRAIFWVNGELIAKLRAANGNFAGGWTVANPSAVAISGDATIERWEVYLGQVPRSANFDFPDP